MVPNYGETTAWVMECIIKNMNSRLSFEFGIYLTQYILYHCNAKTKCPKQYLVFVRENVGIDWKLLDVPEPKKI